MQLKQARRLLICCSLVAATMAHGTPKAPAVPLLDAPINATWAANHREKWREKGFHGFIFQGILDDLSLFPSEATRKESLHGEAETTAPEQIVPGDWDALTDELTGAVNRLRASGIDKNFARIAIVPEAPYFTDPFLARIAEQRMRLLGAFCNQTGLRGIAIDTQTSAAIYDYRWDGHPAEAASETLDMAAHRFGKRLIRAFTSACPKGEILLLAQTPEVAAPLWFNFLDGMLCSFGAADKIPIYLVVVDESEPAAPENYQRRPQLYSRIFQTVLSPKGYERWEGQGGLAFSFEPVRYNQDIPTENYPLPVYRRALYAAALYGGGYVVITAPEGGWWHIPPDTAAQFSHLRQKGRARVRFSPPVPATVDHFSPRLSIADALHLGAFPASDMNAEILRNAKGAALLTWNGLREDLCVPTRTGLIIATNLATGEQTEYTPRDGVITVPSGPGTRLLEGLPMRSFALPAGMEMQLLEPIISGITRANMEIRIYNPLSLPLRGTLVLNTASRYALGATTMTLAVPPGETMTLRRMVQGISYLGSRPRFSTTLLMAAEEPVTRYFSFPVQPPETFRLRMDGPVLGAPETLPQEGNEAGMIITGDARGGLLCLDATTNRQLWRIRARGRYLQPPLVITNTDGVPFIITQNDYGRLRFHDSRGTEKVLVYPSGKTFSGMAAVSVPESAASFLTALKDNKMISIYAPSGLMHNEITRNDHIRHIASNSMVPGFLFVTSLKDETAVKDGTEGVLSAYDLDGSLRWENSLSSPASCKPAICASRISNRAFICASDIAGRIGCYDAYTGVPVLFIEEALGAPATHVSLFERIENKSIFIAQATTEALRLFKFKTDADAPEVSKCCSLPFDHITALTALPDNDGVIVGLANGSVKALSLSGGMLWEDHRSGGAVTGLTTLPDHSIRGAYTCLIAYHTGLVRAIQVRRTLVASESQ